uniref:AT hook containing transcription factor 1 n=1 Tax=Labrus bergylta TaxID=56723 RepID=A0A3Q3EH72_9LABR
MHNLTARVTSSLLPYPAVTVDALGEDEITLDSVLHGKFTVGRSGLAWLACGPHLEVVHAVTGERLSAYCFGGGGEHPPSVLAARDFSWLKRSGLLVGLEEAEGSVLCLYDLGLSRVVKAVVIPGRITAIEPLVSYGGASTSTQHLHQSLRWFFGIAAVVTDLGHVLLVDLCLDDLSCSQSELEASDLQVVTKSPSEIPRLREVSTRQGRHLCLQLNAPSGVGATALQYISRTNQLAVGFSDGYLQLWNMKALKKEYHSQLDSGRVPIHAFTFQEPENDPRNCCYLWAVQSSQDLEGDMVSLRLLQLAFSERKCLASGRILYEGLEYCEERYSQDLSGPAFPLRAQATNTRLLSCQTIEKFRAHPDRDDSMNEVASPDTSVSIFSWQVRAYGQGTPSTYIGVFDINRWYHAQMPDSLRTGESLQNCPYLAVWSLDSVVQMVSQHLLLDVLVHERSLSRGMPFTCPPSEQYFNPTTYNFDATCLLNSGIVHLTCSGYQKETLSFLKKAAPCSSDIISSSYSRCLMSGLLSSRLADTQASSLSQEEQLDAILSTAVETSSLGLITGCIKQWTAEEQPGSALNLRYILDWAWNKVVQTKEELDGICAPLFDSSSNFTDPQTLQLLQHSQRLLSNLSTIFHCLLSEAQELTQKGLVGLMNKNMVSSLISKYAQVVLWFCRTGLLPEGSDDDALQISRPFYTPSVIGNYYTIRREELTRLSKGKWCADCLMIDGLVGQCGDRLTNLWKRDEGGTGQYPPPSLHALLDIYLLENIDEAAKHAIVIYLLLDVMHSLPNKEGASVEFFPTAFAIPIGLVKLVQGLWLLDHHDHQSSFELLLHPASSQCQFKWQHERVLQALMCQGQHPVALRYFQVTKPPISSTAQAKLCLSVLLHNRCLIEAWALLRQHSSRLNMAELMGFLYESCQELGLIKELLKLPLGLAEQECLEKFLQGTGGLQNRELLMVHYLQQANYIPALQLNHSLKLNLVNERDPKLKERTNTRNSILDQYGKVLPRVQRKLAMERAKPYQHSYAIHREVSRPQPLSTITKRSASEKVMSRAGFINNLLTKIEEVWLGKGETPQSSPAKSPKSSSSTLPDPFLGTPITMTSKRKSRLMDLVVHPSCQTPRPLLSPPRPPSSWISPKSTSKGPELSLLQTPQVVKVTSSRLGCLRPVFSAFTPQSILRSSLRPTPVATPSASPGRSLTPPPRSKENRITFIEEAESPEPEKGIRWTNGISLLTRGSLLSKSSRKIWSAQPAEEEEEEEEEQPHVKFLPPEGGIPSPELRCFESEPSSLSEVAAETKPLHLSLSFDTSQASLRSTDTTLEFFDAPLSAVQEGEEGHDTPPVTEEEIVEEVMEIGLDQEVQNEEVLSENEDKQHAESNSEQEGAALLDHEQLSSLNQEEDEEEDEEDSDQSEEEEEEEEEEDSGSEVEIIDEVQGNGRLPPLQPSTVFIQQEHTHFLSDLSEPEAAAFSLITPAAEMKVTHIHTHPEDLEGEVVMVRLGADDGGLLADEEEQGSSYMELKPSTTLLVPLELMEGQDGLVDGAQLDLPELQQTVQDDLTCETQGGFSLMLDVEEDGDKDADTLPMENDLQSSEPPALSYDELVAKPEVILLGIDDQVSEEDQRTEMDSLAVMDENNSVTKNDSAEEADEPTTAEEALPTVMDENESITKSASAEEEVKEEEDKPSPVEEALPTVMDENNSVTKSDSTEEEDKPTRAEEQVEPQENGPVVMDIEISPCVETTTAVEEMQQADEFLKETEEQIIEVSKTEKETTTITRGKQRKPKEAEAEKPTMIEALSSESQPEEPSVLETSTSLRKKKAPSTPTRRTTRGRTVKFISPLTEEAEEPQEDGRVEDVETSQPVPSSPSRTPRKGKQSKDINGQASTPRRSARKAQQGPSNGEVEAIVNTAAVASTSKTSSPGRRRVSQRAASTRSQSGSDEVSAAPGPEIKDEEEQEDDVPDAKVSQRTSSKTPTPAKRRLPEANTPRRSSRRILSGSEVVQTPLEALKEEEQDEVFASPVKRSSRTRQKTGRETVSENTKESEVLHEPELNSRAARTNSHRPTRSQLWDHPEEDLPLLDSPLEVDSETPVADALIKRLQDEEEKQEVISKMVRTSKRSTKSSVEQIQSVPPEKDSLIPEEAESCPDEHSFIYSPSRRRTRGELCTSLHPAEQSLRGRVKSCRYPSLAAGEEKSAPAFFLFPTFRSKAVPEPPPIAQVDLISPLPSPVDPPQRVQRRTKEAEAPASNMNLRRKRIMDTVFTKPVTRRKKL